jgi:signal transduction histidine kinase
MTAANDVHSSKPRWSDTLTPTLVAGFAAIVVILLATLAVGLMNLRQVFDASERVAHTYSVKLGLEELLAQIVDAETGERGFIITNELDYLEPYNGVRMAIARDVAEIRKLMAEVPEHSADLDRLERAVKLKMGELDTAIRLRRESGFDAAHEQVTTDIGKQTMDEIRAIVARMEAREDAMLAIRVEQAAHSYRLAVWTGVATTALALFAIGLLFIGTYRYSAMQVQAKRTAEAQQAQLREALKQKDDFVAVVAHELRTPTNTIVGWARMLLDRTMRPEASGNAINAIARSADSLQQLIDNLMDTSQLVSGRMRLVVASIDFEEVVREAVDTVRLSADNKGVAIVQTIPPDLPHITGDASRLKQVVWNLLANAIKFTPRDGQVHLSVTSTSTLLRLEIRDTGSGIDPAFLPHVFERYRQDTSAHSQRGLGLGLAIVRHLVELHGGKVMAKSAGLGQGATFIVELPLAIGAGEVAAAHQIQRA